MSEPTRADLEHPYTGKTLTDEQFDRIAQEQGYVPEAWFLACAAESRQRYDEIVRLRARLEAENE